MKKSLIWFNFFLFMLILFNCTKTEFKNPYDPEAPNYYLKNFEQTMINYFNSDNDSTVVGSSDNVQSYYGGDITKDYVVDDKLDSRVLKLHINLPVTNDSSRAHWNQHLGEQRFNAQSLGLHYLSFMAKSVESSMKLTIAFFDINSGYSYYDFEIGSGWQRYQIPFESLGLIQSDIDLKNLKYLSFNFSFHNNPGESVLYLDDLAFEKDIE